MIKVSNSSENTGKLENHSSGERPRICRELEVIMIAQLVRRSKMRPPLGKRGLWAPGFLIFASQAVMRPDFYFQSSSDLVAHSGSAGFTLQRMRLMIFKPRLSYRPF